MGISHKVISRNQVHQPSVSMPGLKVINQCYKVITILIKHAWDRSQLNPTYTLRKSLLLVSQPQLFLGLTAYS